MRPIELFKPRMSDLRIDLKEIHLLLGYGEHTPDEDISTCISDIIYTLQKICNPVGCVVIEESKPIDKEHIQIGNSIFSTGKIITSAMRKADKIAIFTASVGKEFDAWCSKLKKDDDILGLFISDAVGSVLAESTVSYIIRHLEKEAKYAGLKITGNYSPGYCDWELPEQKKLFSFFPDNTTGITLTESCLMLPVKSVSGIIGIGENVEKKPYGCEVCKMAHCIKNRNKELAIS